MVSSDLPQELLIDIFSRLPAKSIGQCRCLSKPLCDILSSPHFIKSHLSRKTHHESLFLVSGSQSPLATIKHGAVSRELELPFDYPDIVGSCHGLVLIASKEWDEDKLLVNPATLDKVIIPNSPLAFRDDGGKYFSMHGFGYDSSIDDYKIVTLSSYYNYSSSSDEDENEDWQVSDCAETCVDVYSVKKGTWERLEPSPYNHGYHESHSGTFVNGAIHWLARTREPSYRSLLVAFDLFNEVFTEIPTPADMKMENSYFFQPVVLGGCLCIYARYSSQANVWIMKEYGSVESWTKVSVDTCGGKWGIGRPLCFVSGQEIASAAEGRLLGVYNVKDGTLRDIIVDGVLAVLEDGVTFVPSLVSPANVHRSSLLDVSYANLALALRHNLVLVQHIKDYRTKVTALEQENKAELESELQKARDELSELTGDHKNMQIVIRQLSEKLCKAAMSSFTKRMGRQAYKVSSQFQLDLYQDVVRICRRLLRECKVDEDVVMLVGADVPGSC